MELKPKAKVNPTIKLVWFNTGDNSLITERSILPEIFSNSVGKL